MLKSVLFTISNLAAVIAIGQMTIDASQTPQNLVQNTLISGAVTVSNITFSGNQDQIGYFDGTGSNIGLANGIVMSSGDVNTIPNAADDWGTDFFNAGDPDLLDIAQSVTSNPDAAFITSTNDAAALEFDFVTAGDAVSFNFVFASDEYLDYINTTFNDVFAFFISGPGIVGPYDSPMAFPNGAVNLALVPGTSEPITISTIHPDLNAEYFIGNPSGHSFNGFTIPITIKLNVQCNETYHFKFALADCQDGEFDTGVFLEGNSFQSYGLDLISDQSISGVLPSDQLVEDCVSTTFSLIRPSTSNDMEETITLSYSGSADPSSDFDISLPISVFFPIGTDTVSFDIVPIFDSINEGIETLTIEYIRTSPCGAITSGSSTFFINEKISVDSLYSIPTSCDPPSGIVFAIVNDDNAYGQVQYEWSGPGNPSANVYYATTWDSLSSGWYYFTVKDDICMYNDSVFVDINMPPQAIISPTASIGCAPLSVAFANESQNATSYEWDLGNGNFFDVFTTASQFGVYSDNAIIRLVASNGSVQCNDTSFAFISIASCGCMDPNAENYDPMATFDSGNCEYAAPIVIAPNVFTPNDDDINSVYQLQVSFAEEVELIIVDRWGNTVFDGKGKNPTWDGNSQSGNPVADGVYFYRYKATSNQGESTEGDGFIQVFR